MEHSAPPTAFSRCQALYLRALRSYNNPAMGEAGPRFRGSSEKLRNWPEFTQLVREGVCVGSG